MCDCTRRSTTRDGSREHLRGCEDGMVLVETASGVRSIPLDGIDKARLVPKIEWRKAT